MLIGDAESDVQQKTNSLKCKVRPLHTFFTF